MDARVAVAAAPALRVINPNENKIVKRSDEKKWMKKQQKCKIKQATVWRGMSDA